MEMQSQKSTQTSNIRIFFSQDNILIYCSSRIQQIQADMTYRALELLNLPPDESAFLLDIGCGSGLSGEILDEQGHIWAGVDIAPSMLGETARPTSSSVLMRVLKRLLLNEKWKVISSSRTSDKVLDSVQVVSTERSGTQPWFLLRYSL